jgi:hypothetical protein
MAKYECPFCGRFAHTSGAIPNPNEWLLMSAETHNRLPSSISSDDLYSQTMKLYKCVSCSGIAIFWNGLGADPTWYKPKDA